MRRSLVFGKRGTPTSWTAESKSKSGRPLKGSPSVFGCFLSIRNRELDLNHKIIYGTGNHQTSNNSSSYMS